MDARDQPREQERVRDLMDLVPHEIDRALDVGARDGYLSLQLTRKAKFVTAVDLTAPQFDIPRVALVAGDARSLPFADGSFDLVLCAEVLEHIPQPGMQQACRELIRVARKYVLVGVPFEQDTRVGRTTCGHCNARNPPYGHVNTFGQKQLAQLFSGLHARRWSFVGRSRERTTSVSAWLNDFAGNPWGTYDQDESCIVCGLHLSRPGQRNITQRMASKAAFLIDRARSPFVRERPMWVHVLFEKSLGQHGLLRP